MVFRGEESLATAVQSRQSREGKTLCHTGNDVSQRPQGRLYLRYLTRIFGDELVIHSQPFRGQWEPFVQAGGRDGPRRLAVVMT